MKKLLLTFLLLVSTVFGSGNFEISDGDVRVLSPDGTAVIYFFGSGTGEFEELINNGLSGASGGVYSTADKQLTSDVPETGTLGFWTRTTGPALLTTSTAGDGILTTGTITAGTFTDSTMSLTGGNITSMGNITGDDADISLGTGDILTSGDISIVSDSDPLYTAGNGTRSVGIGYATAAGYGLLMAYDSDLEAFIDFVMIFDELFVNASTTTFYGDVDLDENDLTTTGNITATGNLTVGDDSTDSHTVKGTTTLGGTSDYTRFTSSGYQSLHGDARVYVIKDIALSKMKKGVGNPPADGLEDGFPTLDFDDGVDEEVFFKFKVPRKYDFSTDMGLHLSFFVDTAPVAAAGVAWAVEWKPVATGETFSFAAGTGTIVDVCAVTTGTPANDKVLISCEGITGGANLMEAGDLLMMRLYRDVSDAGDTFVGDARIAEVHVHFIQNKLGSPMEENYLLLEDGAFLLNEDGSKIILEL